MAFDYSGAIEINIARMRWLDKLNIDYKDKIVLETGVGARGDFTSYLEKHDANLFLIEARPENITEHLRRFPHRKDKFYCIDMNNRYYLDVLPVRRYDIVVCLGTLYHLSNPEDSLRELCCNTEALVLETQISSSGTWNRCYENRSIEDQSFDGIGCRPNVEMLRKLLGRYFKIVDETYQPDHVDYHTGARRCFYCHN